MNTLSRRMFFPVVSTLFGLALTACGGNSVVAPDTLTPDSSTDKLFITTAEGLQALNAGTGEQFWSVPLAITDTVTLMQQTEDILYWNAGRVVYATEIATGKELWQYQTQDANGVLQIVVDGDKLYLSDKNRLLAFDRHLGKQLWTAPEISDIPAVSLYARGKEVYTIGANGAASFDAETGKHLWTNNALQNSSGMIVGSLRFVQDTVIVIRERYVVAFRESDKDQLWQIGKPDDAQARIAGFVQSDRLYLFGNLGDASLAAYDPLSGKRQWSIRDEWVMRRDAYVAFGENGFFAAHGKYEDVKQIEAYNLDDGALLWKKQAPPRVAILHEYEFYDFWNFSGVIYITSERGVDILNTKDGALFKNYSRNQAEWSSAGTQEIYMTDKNNVLRVVDIKSGKEHWQKKLNHELISLDA